MKWISPSVEDRTDPGITRYLALWLIFVVEFDSRSDSTFFVGSREMEESVVAFDRAEAGVDRLSHAAAVLTVATERVFVFWDWFTAD